MSDFLFTDAEWDFDKLDKVYDACEVIATEELRLDTYPNQIEVITSEQMLDAYSSVGLPVYYKHWSFGKQFTREEDQYRRGQRGLAYEIVINSSPCINYLMEENTMTTQSLVIAHAAFGHNSFFKNNYLFREWTDAENIVDYLVYAKGFIEECEEKHGVEVVEKVLDACHALTKHGINKYKRPSKLSMVKELEKRKERQDYLQSQVNDLWRTVPKTEDVKDTADDRFPKEPEENLLYFIEKNSPILTDWQREIVRITRKISQYFYPQYQTKVMNEGWASFCHHYIMSRMYDKGQITEGSMLEFAHMHSNVLYQPDYNDKNYSGFNPYKLGFEMFTDIRRICEHPTDEDREWFPDYAGQEDWVQVCLDAVKNYRDESFIKQFLSPTLMRKFHMFALHTSAEDKEYEVTAIHNKRGFQDIRNTLAANYEVGNMMPDIQIWDADLKGDRKLTLRHTSINSKALDKQSPKVLAHVKTLWGYQVVLESWSVFDDEEFMLDRTKSSSVATTKIE